MTQIPDVRLQRSPTQVWQWTCKVCGLQEVTAQEELPLGWALISATPSSIGATQAQPCCSLSCAVSVLRETPGLNLGNVEVTS
jgi:hypothetical protein